MGDRLDGITPELKRAIEEAPMFFVATAPLSAAGHVNLSPKGHQTLRVLGPRRVAYLDLTGSGNETAAHVTENTRLTIMVCAFSGSPQIVRLYCHGRVVGRGSAEWQELEPMFPSMKGMRQIVLGDVEFVKTSCGFAVPEMSIVAQRDTLMRWAEGKGEDGLANYRKTHNEKSLDGVPAPRTDA